MVIREGIFERMIKGGEEGLGGELGDVKSKNKEQGKNGQSQRNNFSIKQGAKMKIARLL